jgi:hypothetical protein
LIERDRVTDCRHACRGSTSGVSQIADDLSRRPNSSASGQQRTPAVHTGSEKRLNPLDDLLDGFELHTPSYSPQKNASGLGTMAVTFLRQV